MSHAPGGQRYPGGDPYGYPYGPEAVHHGPGPDPRGPGARGYRQPDPGFGQGQPGQYGPGEFGPGQPGAGHPGPGQYTAGPYGPGAYGPGGFGPGQPGPGQPGPGQRGPGRQSAPGQFDQGHHDSGQYDQRQWAPGPGPGADWAEPGQRPPQEQRQPGTGGGRLGYPPPNGVRNTGGWANAGGPVIRQRDSALPDPPPNVKGPIAAIETDNIAAFARDLRVLRSKADLDYPDMAEKSHYTMRTLASAAGGLRLPTLPVLIAYVKACGGDVAEWEERWGKLVKSGKNGRAALPAAGTDTSNDEPGITADGLPGKGSGGPGAGPVPSNAPPSGEVYVITSAKPRDDRW